MVRQEITAKKFTCTTAQRPRFMCSKYDMQQSARRDACVKRFVQVEFQLVEYRSKQRNVALCLNNKCAEMIYEWEWNALVPLCKKRTIRLLAVGRKSHSYSRVAFNIHLYVFLIWWLMHISTATRYQIRGVIKSLQTVLVDSWSDVVNSAMTWHWQYG